MPISRGFRSIAFSTAAWLALAGLSVGAHAGPVHPSAADTRPLSVGTSVPSAEVETLAGGRVDLTELARESGVLLVFYRGGW